VLSDLVREVVAPFVGIGKIVDHFIFLNRRNKIPLKFNI
jgi:hypothetical protein